MSLGLCLSLAPSCVPLSLFLLPGYHHMKCSALLCAPCHDRLTLLKENFPLLSCLCQVTVVINVTNTEILFLVFLEIFIKIFINIYNLRIDLLIYILSDSV
jgi:hypothetical protein